MSEWWEALLTVEKVLYCIAVPSTIILIVQTIMLLFGAGGHEGYNPSDTSGIDFDTDFDGMSGGMDIGHGIGGLHGGMDMSHDIGGLHGGMDMSHDMSGLHSGIDMNHSIDGFHGNTKVHPAAEISRLEGKLHSGDGSSHDAAHSQPQDFDTLRIFTLQGLVAFFTMFSWSALAGISQGVQSVKAILIGIVMGFVLMYIVALIIKYSKRLSEDGTFDMRDTLGHQAVVYIPIPPQNSGAGKVNISINNRFIEYSAVTEEKRTIKTGESVRITDIVNDSVVVEIE